jgi:hypothetical protein
VSVQRWSVNTENSDSAVLIVIKRDLVLSDLECENQEQRDI